MHTKEKNPLLGSRPNRLFCFTSISALLYKYNIVVYYSSNSLIGCLDELLVSVRARRETPAYQQGRQDVIAYGRTEAYKITVKCSDKERKAMLGCSTSKLLLTYYCIAH